jgi:NodT family efflux transporter outer membrane factor (OMF) lipoprotein
MNFRIIPTLSYSLLMTQFAGCMVGPDYIKPQAGFTDTYKEVKGWKQAQPPEEFIPDKWWEIFKNAELNKLEEQVNSANQSIAQAESQYKMSQSMVQSATSAYFPTATGTLTANRFRASSGQSVAVNGVKYLFGGVLSAAWAPDIFGGLHRQVESSVATAQSRAATLYALQLTNQATLAQSYFQLRTLDSQRKLFNETVASYEKNLTIIKNRYEAGVAAKSDIVQAETQLESARAQAINLGIQRAQLEHAIAVLIGKPPAELSIDVSPLNTPVPPIPVSVPSKLLERRPDIAVAERAVAAANAQIGVAKAAYFPNLNLAASEGQQSTLLSNVITQGARYWALGPASLAIPLFDGGARSAVLQSAMDSYDASVAGYRQAVLTSFQQVEDNLAALRILEEEIQVQNKATEAAHQAVQLTTNQYEAGTVSYLNVIVNQAAALNNDITAVNLQGQRLSAAVLLVKALGGGWDTSDLPTKDQAGGSIKWSQFLPVPLNMPKQKE